MVGTIIVRAKKGRVVKDFRTNPMGTKFVDITFGRRGMLGKFLKGETTRRVRTPKGTRVTEINNNNPRVGSVRIRFRSLTRKATMTKGRLR